ncbi:MAG: hypothetical protein ACREQ5_00865 [Candidatus Dormibacteria bacterium]
MTTAVAADDTDTAEEWMARGTYGLIAVVGLVVLAVSSRYLHEYAVTTGMTDWLSWSLVVALDAGGAGGTLAWIIGRGMARTWGRGIALANLGGSLVGNILGHLISAHQMSNSPWLTILTGAVYPAELWAMVHLGLLLSRERRPVKTVPQPVPQPVPHPTATAAPPIPPAAPIPSVQRPTPVITPPHIPTRQIPAPARPTAVPAAKTNGITDELLTRARKFHAGRLAKNQPCGRRVLMTQLGVTDRVARELATRLANDKTMEAVA